MILQSHDLIGICGGLCVLISYILLQLNKMSATSYSYLNLNLIGALLIMFSLFNEWNLTAFSIEVIWAAISLYAIGTRYLASKH